MPDETGDGEDHDLSVQGVQFRADALARGRVRAESGWVATVADGDGVAVDVEAAGVVGLGFADGQEDVGDVRGQPLHGEANDSAWPGAGEIEPEAVARVGDARDAHPPRGHARQEAADRHVRVHQVGALVAEQTHKIAEGAPMGQWRGRAFQSRRDDAEALGPRDTQQGTVGADADDLVTAGAHGAHQRQQEMAERKVDVGDFDDFQGSSPAGANMGFAATGRKPTLSAASTRQSPMLGLVEVNLSGTRQK